MFKKVTSSPSWEKAPAIVAKLPPHYPVLSAKELLRGKQVQTILTQLKTLAFVPEHTYEDLYEQALFAYAEFVQGLPATQVEHFNYHGGLLELGIRRALQTLAWYRREHPIRQYTPEQVPVRQAIWSYALFTAGLFYGLGQVVATYWVMLCHENGAPDKRWNPVIGMMKDQGDFYRYCFEPIRRDDLAGRSTPILAKNLMPEMGIGWIATDIEIFNQWLAILLNDADHAGLFAKLLLSVDADLTKQANAEAGLIIGEVIQHYDFITPPTETNQERIVVVANAAVNPTAITPDAAPPQVAAAQHSVAGKFATGKEINPGDIASALAIGDVLSYFADALRRMLRERNPAISGQVYNTPAGLYISERVIDHIANQTSNPEQVKSQILNSSLNLGKAKIQKSTALIESAAAANANAWVFETSGLLGKKMLNAVTDYNNVVIQTQSPYPANRNAATPAAPVPTGPRR